MAQAKKKEHDLGADGRNLDGFESVKLYDPFVFMCVCVCFFCFVCVCQFVSVCVSV